MEYYNKPIGDVLKELGTSEEKGLSTDEVNERLVRYGHNEIREEKPISAFMIFINQFKSFIIAILIAAVVISVLIAHYLDAVIIGVILVLNAVLGFVQEYKAEKSIEALKKLASLKAVALRDGIEREIDANDLVPGDIIVLETGDKVPADARLLDVVNLETQEAVLTGESLPVRKELKVLRAEMGVADRVNMIFSGTIVTRGRGKAVVTETGMGTEIGKIAGMMQAEPEQMTPLQIKLKRLGEWLGLAAIIFCAAVFGIGIMVGFEKLQMLMTALSLAVAAIPEGLPAVVTIGLALGVQRMVKKNALIRKLPSVETLGSTTTICVPGDTLIFGDSSINAIKEIKEGDKVLGVDGNFHAVKKLFKRPYCGELIAIKPVGLPEVKFTPEHPILVSKMIRTRPSAHSLFPIKRPRITKLSEPEWIPANQITKNHVVLVPRLKKEEDFFLKFKSGRYRENKGIVFDDELAELFGWYLAEGCCSSTKGSHHIIFYLGKQEKEQAERLKYLIKKKLGLKSYLYEVRTSLRLVVINKDLVIFLKKEFGKRAINKKIPDFIMNSKEENIISFIRAYLKGDGTISKNILSLRFSTTSKILAYQLVLLLNKIGIKGKLYKNKLKRIHFIEGRKVICSDSYTIIINGTQADRIHPLHRELKKKKRNLDLFDKNFVYYTIRTISKKHESLDVYNIETESQSYCLPFIVHNCSDKTGTLTHNEMTVRKIFANNRIFTVTGSGYSTIGNFYYKTDKIDPKELKLLLQIGALCSDAKLANEELIGDPTEGALIVSAAKAGLIKRELELKYPRIEELEFTSERKRMSTLHRINGKMTVCCKGAPDVLLELCDRIYIDGKVRRITKTDKTLFIKVNEALAGQALRVLGFAYKESEKLDEKNMIFVGMQGMIDPPRDEVKEAIAKCKTAGIRVVMITGDHKITAEAVGKELGLEGKAIDGKELEQIKHLEDVVEDIAIYARIDPKHKVKILEALKKKGHIVAMTGDGVNDAPALKKADIGIAMGITGTDVAKEASDMILTDDNFASIVNAVEEGRSIFDNIRKFVKYLISSNLGELLTLFVAIIMKFPLPLVAIQILWINLVTDGLPALALSVDPADLNIMNRAPRNPKEGIITKGRALWMIFTGIIMMAGTLAVFRTYDYEINLAYAQTMAFTTLVLFQMFNVLNCRSEKNSIFRILLTNKYMLGAILVSVALQVAAVHTPLNTLFHTTQLRIADWGYALLVSCSVLVFGEIVKLFKRK